MNAMHINWNNILVAESGILIVIFLHLTIFMRYGTARVRERIDAGIEISKKLWIASTALVSCSLIAVVTAVPLAHQLTGSPKQVSFLLEVVVSGFGLLSILSVIYPLILQRERLYADRLTISTIILLSIGSFAGTIFKALVTNEQFKNSWTVYSGLTFLTCFYAIAGLFLYSLGLLILRSLRRDTTRSATK